MSSSARLNITREEAAQRAAALTVDAYEVSLDLTHGPERFRTASTLTFAASEDAVGPVTAPTQDLQRSEGDRGERTDGMGCDEGGERGHGHKILPLSDSEPAR